MGGGMIRDNKGRMLLAYSGQLGKVSNNTMEVMALYWDLKLVIIVGWRDVEIEGNSKLIIEIIKGNMREGWVIKDVLEDIRYILTILNRFDLKHII